MEPIRRAVLAELFRIGDLLAEDGSEQATAMAMILYARAHNVAQGCEIRLAADEEIADILSASAEVAELTASFD